MIMLLMVKPMFSIRLAVSDDIDAIFRFDQVAQREEYRRALIIRSVDAGTCSVMVDEEQVVGYAVLDYSFFEQGFISVLYIHPDYRRRGAGLRLMQHRETSARRRSCLPRPISPI